MKKLNTSSIMTVLLLGGILIMVNVIGIRAFVRTDLTSGQIYSLSEASKDIVGSIEDRLVVKAYFSPDLPGQYGGVARYLRDMLEDYRAYSEGHMTYQFIDPGSEEELEQEAQSFNIPPIRMQAYEKDKVEVKRAYMGLVFIYGDKSETIPTVTSIDNLEYEITSLIHRLTNPEQPVLGLTTTGAPQQAQTEMQRLYESLGRLYDIRPVNLDQEIDAGLYDGIFIVAPREPLTDWQLFNIDQYIMNGGKLGVFANSYRVNLQQQQAMLNDLNLSGFLQHYGLGLGRDMVYDAESGSIQVQMQQGFFNIRQPVQVPYMPIVQNFNPTSVITRKLQNYMMFFPSSVDTTYAVDKGYNVEGLLYTSDHAGRKSGQYVPMNFMQQMQESDFNEQHIPLAATVSGIFESYFAEAGPPEKPAGDDGQMTVYDGEFLPAAESSTRLIVSGDGMSLMDEYVQDGRQLLFAQNTADWLLLSESLIDIRSKSVSMEPLKELPDFMRNFVKWLNRLGPVFLVIVLGIALWQTRRVKNKALMDDVKGRQKHEE